MQKDGAAFTLFLSISIVSASSLAYEILVMRLFSIVQWHHFAYMVISLALLGYGVSGTFITLLRKQLFAHFPKVYILNLLFFASSAPAAFFIAQHIPFNAQEMLLDPRGILWLLLYFLLFSLPFFFAANAVGLALSFYRKEISGLYAADMFGAGLGSFAILLLFYHFHPTTILQMVSTFGIVAAVLASLALKTGKLTTLFLLTATLLPFFLPNDFKEIRISPYKGLSQTLQIKGTRIVDEEVGPMGIITVVESPEIPFRYAPGVSLYNETEPPEQLGLFVNGEWAGVITRYPQNRSGLKYLDYLTSALAYHVTDPKKVLIVGADGGMDVLQALFHDVEHIDGVEMDATIVNLVKVRYADFSGHIYEKPNVHIDVDDARGFILKNAKKYDLIQFALPGPGSGSSSGLSALSEDYLFTVEAFQSYLKYLRPGGYLSITRWIKLPPRDSLKLVTTAMEAFERRGMEAPEKRLLLIRGWQTTTLLIKNGLVHDREIEKMKAFCLSRGFDPIYYYGMPLSEANRFNILEHPIFHTSVTNLLEDPGFSDRYRFDIRPATDDRPYFHHFFTWESFFDILSLRETGGLYLMEWGYLILVATLLLAVVLSIVLILLPLLVGTGRLKASRSFGKNAVLAYFFMLGIAFMFLEIAFIQKFVLFISHPIFSAAIVLSTFLLFAGMGSGFSHSLIAKKGDATTLKISIIAIVLFTLSDLLILHYFHERFVVLPFAVKTALTVITLAPLAFSMGIPFPLGLSFLASRNAPLVPWAWGVNGCASVISAILASLLAVHLGFTIVIFLALSLYVGTLFVFPKK